MNPRISIVTVLAAVLFAAGYLRSAQPGVDPQLFRGFLESAARNDIVPGELIIDPPTLENLGFRWFVEGDANRNATVDVAFRRKGDDAWREAQPMLRVRHELVQRAQVPYRTGNLFAGSVLFLEPGTEYEVRLVMSDPDGGAPEEPKMITVATRSEPVVWEHGRTLHVYPASWRGERSGQNAYDAISAAYSDSLPGDIIFLHAGTHQAQEAPYLLTRSGEPGRPIVFRGAGAGESILEGPGLQTDLFRLAGADHIAFEHLTLRRARTAIAAGSRGNPGASWLTVRRCTIEEVVNGIWTTSESSQNWYIADNVITGIDREWYPRPNQGYMDGSHTGVNVYGQGHVVGYNRISRFSDSLAIANFSGPATDDLLRHAVNIDFYNNDLSFAIDDTIEADYGCHNVRIYRNLNYNAHTALSVQPAYGGPIYLIRNVAYGITSINLKWNNFPAGPIAYHNTLITAGTAFRSPFWSNGHLRNNLILGNQDKIATGTFTPEISTLDYNGYHGGNIHWTHGEDERRTYSTLAEFSAATGYEKHGIEVDFDVFVKARPVKPGTTYTPADFDLRLRAGSEAVNAGARLANINDAFTGSGPDLGAYERGSSPPRYGPRPE